jgi:hypothetical protein
MSISRSPRLNWRRCDGRFDAVHHLEAMSGGPKEHVYLASILNSADQGARRPDRITSKRLPSPFRAAPRFEESK